MRIINLKLFHSLTKKNIWSHLLLTQKICFVKHDAKKKIEYGNVHAVCVLDFDGDIVNKLLEEEKATLNKTWACCNLRSYNFIYNNIEFGIIGSAVGTSFVVMVAEELFESGCQLRIV
ncbi:MAG: hypothetical protein ABII27_09175 [bacterium]